LNKTKLITNDNLYRNIGKNNNNNNNNTDNSNNIGIGIGTGTNRQITRQLPRGFIKPKNT
jgi:hypothetical protein